MPSPGKSLVGFMDQAQALEHLKTACVPPANATDASLLSEWQTAKGKLGQPIANAGNPNIQPIPPGHALYVGALFQLPWVTTAFQGQGVTAANVQYVEIDPLLAFQFIVDTTRSDHHCGALATPPTTDELFNTCLPTAQPTENINWQVQDRSAVIKSRSLNLRMLQWGMFNNTAAGIIFGAALPLVQVSRFQGRCYLSNGFHRAHGLRLGGATHMPCIVRDVATAGAAGIQAGTFSETLLISADPPTLGHFTQNRALDVQIRATSRILHVSWADYVFPEE
jgi:hypothetical protein